MMICVRRCRSNMQQRAPHMQLDARMTPELFKEPENDRCIGAFRKVVVLGSLDSLEPDIASTFDLEGRCLRQRRDCVGPLVNQSHCRKAGGQSASQILTGASRTVHRAVESVRHLRNITLREGADVRVDCESEAMRAHVALWVRLRGRSQERQPHHIALDGAVVSRSPRCAVPSRCATH